MRTLVNLAYVVTGLVLTLQAYLATKLGAFAGMYREFGGTVPLITRIALSSAWAFGAPLVIAGLLLLAILKNRTYPRLPIAVALISVAILVGTYAAAEWPVFKLAGNIH